MSENLFTGNNGGSDPADTNVANPSNTNSANDQQPYLVVGDRAFQKPEDVVKKISSADEHISKLEQEAAELRETVKRSEEALGNSANMDRLMARLDGIASNPTATPAGDAQADPIDITAQVEQVLTNRERSKIENDNLAIAQAPFIEGANGNVEAAGKALASACTEIGLSLDDAQELAKKSPNAFFKMLGVNSSKTNSPTIPDIASSGNKQNPGAPVPDVTNVTPGSYADLKNQWKTATDSKAKASIMRQIDSEVAKDINFMNTN